MKWAIPLLTFLFITANIFASEKKLVFGVAPQQSATMLIEAWSPLIEKIKNHCECQIQFATAPSIKEFELKVKNKDFDLIYLNPLHFVNAQKLGYTSLVREEGRKLKGIIVVRKDSAIQKLSDLEGKKMAFPGETAFAATILVQKELELSQIGIDAQYVKSHDSVYQNVISGLMPAGGAVNRTFESLSAEDKSQLRILKETPSVTPHPIAIKKTVPNEIKKKLQQSLVDLNKTDEGRKILDKLEFKPLVEAQDSDWDDVRKIIGNLKLK